MIGKLQQQRYHMNAGTTLPFGKGVRITGPGGVTRVAVSAVGRIRVMNEGNAEPGLNWPPNMGTGTSREGTWRPGGVWHIGEGTERRPVLTIALVDRDQGKLIFTCAEGCEVGERVAAVELFGDINDDVCDRVDR